MFIKIKAFRDPAPAGAEGGLPPTLEELFTGAGSAPTGVEGGDGKDKAPNLEEEELKKKAAEEGKTPEEGGEPKEEEDGGKGEGDENKGEEGAEEGDEPQDVDPVAFFTAVDQITGEPVKVEYGDVDPLSPEGVAIRDRAVRQDEVQKFETHLKTDDPRAFAYFLHRQAGGDDASFFADKTVALPDEATFKASVATQTSLYKQSLIDRGVDEDIAEAQVAKAIKDNTLEAKSLQVYKQIQESQAQQLAEIEAAIDLEEAAFQKQVTDVINTVNTAIDNGSMKFIVPDAKKGEFKQFVKDSLRHEGGKFYAVTEVGESPQSVLESLFFQYIKGDLKSLVEKRAETKAVQRLKLGVQKASGGLPKGSEGARRRSDYVPLGDI